MRKLIVIVAALALVGFLTAQAITNVRLEPAQSTYYVGNHVTIKWDASGLQNSDEVILTIFREGNSQNICRVFPGQKFPATQGAQGISWTIPETCTNPNTGQEENLLQGRIKIRVRWTNWGANVWGESPYFSINKITVNTNINVQLKPKFPTTDLYVFGVKIESERSKIYTGTMVTIKTSIKNSGIDFGGSGVLRLFIAGPQGFTPIRKNLTIPALKGSNNQTIYLKYSFTPSIAGAYRVKVEIDPDKKISSEENRNNNTGTASFYVYPRADLIVCLPTNVKAKVGKEKTVYIKVINLGPGEAPASTLRVYIKSNGVKYFNVPPLRKGEVKLFSRKVKWWTTGKKRMKAIIDYYKKVVEANENNNEIETKAKVELPKAFVSFDTSGLPKFICSDGKSY